MNKKKKQEGIKTRSVIDSKRNHNKMRQKQSNEQGESDVIKTFHRS